MTVPFGGVAPGLLLGFLQVRSDPCADDDMRRGVVIPARFRLQGKVDRLGNRRESARQQHFRQTRGVDSPIDQVVAVGGSVADELATGCLGATAVVARGRRNDCRAIADLANLLNGTEDIA